jgi:hypothetical protein
MSSESESAGLLKLRRLLKSEGIGRVECPMCHRETWDLGTSADVGVPVIKERDPATGDTQGIAGSVHAMTMTCLTCGYLALFDYDVLDRAQ